MPTEITVQKDVWDIVAILLQASTPLLVALIAALVALLVTRRREDEANRIAAVSVLSALLPNLSSADHRTRELARLTLLHLGRDSWSNDVAGSVSVLMAGSDVSEVRFARDGDRLVHGWLAQHIIPVWINDWGFLTGVRVGVWLVLPTHEAKGGVAFWVDGAFVLDQLRAHRLSCGCVAYQLGDRTARLAPDTADVSRGHAIYAQLNGPEIHLLAAVVERSVSEPSWRLVDDVDGADILGGVIVSGQRQQIVGAVHHVQPTGDVCVSDWSAVSGQVDELRF